MEIAEAVELIRTDMISERRPQAWCDLGCGTGTFTRALATLLPEGSTIHAIDKGEASLAQVPDHYRGVTIVKRAVDVTAIDFALTGLDGVLMANLLHFIRDQDAFLEKLRTVSGRLLVVEYNNREASRWVPFPVGFASLRTLLFGRGFTRVAKLGTRPSRFSGELYSAFAE